MYCLLLAAANDSFALFTAAVGAIGGWLLTLIASHFNRQHDFDHRLRLVKEFEIYTDLWEKLFNLRKYLGTGTSAFGIPDIPNVVDCFNQYQSIIRKNEPFIAGFIYRPARKILTVGRTIVDNLNSIYELDKRRHAHWGSNIELDEKIANDLVDLEAKNVKLFDEIESLFEAVSKAIRKRVGPQDSWHEDY